MRAKNTNKLIILFILAIFANTTKADNATIIIYQKESSGQAIRVFINQRYVGILQPKSYVAIPVCPEKNLISISMPTPSTPIINLNAEWQQQQDTLFFEAFQLNNDLHLIAIENSEYAHSVIQNLRSFAGLSRSSKTTCSKEPL